MGKMLYCDCEMHCKICVILLKSHLEDHISQIYSLNIVTPSWLPRHLLSTCRVLLSLSYSRTASRSPSNVWTRHGMSEQTLKRIRPIHSQAGGLRLSVLGSSALDHAREGFSSSEDHSALALVRGVHNCYCNRANDWLLHVYIPHFKLKELCVYIPALYVSSLSGC